MKRAVLVTATLLLGSLGAVPDAEAVTCARGVYRAGCAGPNGAAVVRRPAAPPARRAVNCASGPYRAGCLGPNGAAVVRRPS
ncbi:hypothetical protein [Muricoccus radiodurans]|uniref:hypothetical protein n=1 Tax=Muricoccus radiodurans TaxID=2231721 RepID=UPI003CF0182E